MHRTCIYHRIVSGSKAAKARFTCHFTVVFSTTALTHGSRCWNFLHLRLLVFQVRSEVGRHRHRSIFSKSSCCSIRDVKIDVSSEIWDHLIAAIATSDFEIFEQPSSSAILEMPPMPPICSEGHQGQLKGGWLMGGHKSYAFFLIATILGCFVLCIGPGRQASLTLSGLKPNHSGSVCGFLYGYATQSPALDC